MAIEELVAEYLNYIYVVEQKAKSTKDSYGRELKKYQAFLENNGFSLSDINNQVLMDYLVTLDNDNYASINHALTAIRSFHDYINRFHAELLNFSVQIKGKKVPKHLPTFLTQDEVNLLIENCDDLMDQTILKLLYATGMRVSELINLKLNNFNLEHGFLRCLGKRNKERIIPIYQQAVISLKDYLELRKSSENSLSSHYVFINKKGRPLSRQYVFKIVKENCQKNGISTSISPHSLRHTFASLMLDNGADLRVIQELLGHADIATTQIYTHLQTKRLKTAYDQYHPGNLREDNDDSTPEKH